MINNKEQTFYEIYKRLLNEGRLVSPRGLKVLEVENFNYVLPPYCRFACFGVRKLSIEYIKKEFLWYLKGAKYDVSIGEHASMWKKLIGQDGSINSNYGRYIFNELKQFDTIIDILKQDKDSRRASIVILQPYHVMENGVDTPCTYSINFRIREDRLNMTVRMRSQDAILGMGNDAPTFSFIQEMVYMTLKDIYPYLELGNYYHSADSFHVYERHFKMLRDIVDGDVFYNEDVPKISSSKEVEFLRNLDFSNIPENYQFTKWLTL